MKRTETKGNRKNSSRRFTALMLVLFMGLQLLAPAAIPAAYAAELDPEEAASYEAAASEDMITETVPETVEETVEEAVQETVEETVKESDIAAAAEAPQAGVAAVINAETAEEIAPAQVPASQAAPRAAQTVESAPAAIEISAMNNTEIVPDNAAPAAAPSVQILTDIAAPVAAPALGQGWALINLITVIAAAIAAAAMILRSKRDDDSDRNWSKFTGLVPFIASAMAFLLTENMQNRMVLTDRWTVLMIAILAAQAAIAVATREKKEEE